MKKFIGIVVVSVLLIGNVQAQSATPEAQAGQIAQRPKIAAIVPIKIFCRRISIYRWYRAVVSATGI